MAVGCDDTPGASFMIRRLFIANRGEIALRILRTARRLGITAILGASDADLDALPARLADEVVRVGPGPSALSYLSIERVIAAAKAANADAVHPGYGFLSENAAFARAAAAAGMIFVGPDPAALEAMGDKLRARAAAVAAGLPVVPGGEAANAEEARARARDTGWPLLLKAVAGGGGRGMKRVDDEAGLEGAFALAAAEAQAAFGDPRIYVERLIGRGRHVEVQILGDGARAVHLGDRDCSIQRRYQKLVEEAPAPDLPDDRRAALHAAAVRLAEHISYRGAGTVEFLVDAGSFDFFFLEMNARIQVEHPVTEAVTGIDLVEQQLLLADGHKLGLDQSAVRLAGHAIEARINAEDVAHDFRPSPGTALRVAWPAGPGIRVDSHIAAGGRVPPLYDSLVGKVIAAGATRDEAVARLRAALADTRIDGIATNLAFHRAVLEHPEFEAGGVDTGFLTRFIPPRLRAGRGPMRSMGEG